MDTTRRLKLPYILQSQAQKEVTHNEALEILDVSLQACVIDAGLNEPPKIIQEGDTYLVGSNPKGAWQGRKYELATYREERWRFITPFQGFLTFVHKTSQLCVFDGKEWQLLGADPNKHFTIEGNSPTFSHKGGDVQLKINRNTNDNKAALLFCSSNSARAEIGLIGNNNLLFKTAVNSQLIEALKILENTGRVVLKSNSHSLQATDTYQITKQTNEFTTVTANSSALLPIPESGDCIFIANASTNALSIRPARTHYINNSDKPYLLAPGKSNIFWAATNNKWYTV